MDVLLLSRCTEPVSHPREQGEGLDFSPVCVCGGDREKGLPSPLIYSGCLLPSESVSTTVLTWIPADFPFGGKIGD